MMKTSAYAYVYLFAHPAMLRYPIIEFKCQTYDVLFGVKMK